MNHIRKILGQRYGIQLTFSADTVTKGVLKVTFSLTGICRVNVVATVSNDITILLKMLTVTRLIKVSTE